MRLAHVLVLVMLGGCGGAAPTPTAPAVVGNEGTPPPPPVDGVQHVGNPDAAVALTYYFDYACPPCVAIGPGVDALAERHGERIVIHYKNFQLASHPLARGAGIAAEAARRQGRFVDMHRALVARSPRLEPAELRTVAAELGLDLPRYDADVADPTAAARVDREYGEGVAAGVEGVPAIFLDGQAFTGGGTLDALAAAIDAALAAAP